MTAADRASDEATLELLGDPESQQRISRSEQDVDRGDVLDEAAVRALLSGSKREGC